MNYTVYQKDTLEKLQKVEREILKFFIDVCEENRIDYYMFGGSLLGTIRHQGFIPWDDDIDVLMFRKDYERFAEIMKKKKSEQFYLVSTQTEKDYFLYFPKLMMRGTTFKEWWADQVEFPTGIFVDIFILDGLPKKRIRQKIHIFRTRVLTKMLAVARLKFHGYPKRIQYPVNLFHWLFRVIHLSPEYLKKRTLSILERYDAKECRQCFSAVTVPYPPVFEREDFGTAEKGNFEGLSVKIPKNYDRLLRILYGDYMKLPPEDERYNHCTSEIELGIYGEEK